MQHKKRAAAAALVDFLEGGEADAELASALDDVHQLAVAELVRGPTVCDGDDPFHAVPADAPFVLLHIFR